MSKIQIYCKTCQICLTPVLNELPADFICSLEEETDYLPQGFYKLNQNSMDWKAAEDTIIINVKDLIHAKNHDDYRRCFGCCGLDGCDGANKMCINGHEIATECSDCWMPHAVLFEMDKIDIQAA